MASQVAITILWQLQVDNITLNWLYYNTAVFCGYSNLNQL